MTDTLQSFPALDTDRLTLRPLRRSDAEALRALTDDPVIAAAIPFFAHPFTLADAEDLVARWDGSRDVMLGVWRTADRVLTGVVALHLRGDGEVELGYWFGAAFHGRGYASEAVGPVMDAVCRLLPQRLVYAECRPANRGSWRVLEKAGFRATGEDGERPERKRLALV